MSLAVYFKVETNFMLNITSDQIEKGKWQEDWMEVRKGYHFIKM